MWTEGLEWQAMKLKTKLESQNFKKEIENMLKLEYVICNLAYLFLIITLFYLFY